MPWVQQRIFKTLETAGCESTGLMINTIYVARPEPHWTASDFNLEFDRIQSGPPPKPECDAIQRSLKLTVVYGAAGQQTYVFTTSRINLGRRLDVRDNQNRLMRTNHVAFTECAEEPNPGVSRRHAHRSRGSPAEYRLYDNRSAHGTSVQRSGVTIVVPPGTRGIRLQSGDEIALGEARLQVEIETAR